MKVPFPFKRTAICLSTGVVTGAIAGAFLGYLYGKLDQTTGMFAMPYLGVVVMANYTAVLGGLLGSVIGMCNLRRLWGTLLGLGAGLCFVVLWITFVGGQPTKPDEAIMEAIVPVVAVIGFLISTISRLLSPRAQADVPKDEWQNNILTQ